MEKFLKFLKENWFKIIVLIIILLCSSLFFVYKTKQQEMEKQAELNDLNGSCQKLASQKKDEIGKDDHDLYIGTYEYKYNSTYKACILAYTGSYFGDSVSSVFGHYLFKIENLLTGESIMREQVDPGDSYKKTNEEFTNLKSQYIGSVQNNL